MPSQNMFESSTFDWDGYLRHRPEYQPGLYDLIFDYHNSKPGTALNIAHDVGAGLGNVTEVLAERGFKSIVASDSSAFHIGVAKDRLTQLRGDDVQSGRITFKASAAEELIASDAAKPGEADMVTVAECIPLMDAPKAVEAFAELLKPGGTLAIWFYGRPLFVPSEGWDEGKAEKAQKLYLKLAARVYDEYVPFESNNLGRAWTRIGSWLDDVELSAEKWGGVKRMKWNGDKPLYFMDEGELTFVKYNGRIGEEEELIAMKKDDEIWKSKISADWVRGFVDNLIPRKDKAFSPEMERLYKELAEVMGGKSVERDVHWTATLILATKK